MNYSIYIDESGNTGNPRLKNGNWNWGIQTHFTLGSICVKEQDIYKLEDVIWNVLSNYDNTLGRELELKSTSNYIFKNDLINDLMDVLKNQRVKLHFDISNKKYKIIMNLVEYCIYPNYIYNDIVKLRSEKVRAATYVYYNLDDQILNKYIEVCNSDMRTDEHFYYNEFQQFLSLLINSIKDIELKSKINEIKEYIIDYKKKNITINELFPIQDHTNKNSIMSFLPNLDAFLSIITSTTNLYLKHNDNLIIYHDEQKQFDKSFIKWIETIIDKGYNSAKINKIEFKESKNNILLQTVDFITGNISQSFYRGIKNDHSRLARDIGRNLKFALESCNIVSTLSEQEAFFKAYGIKSVPTDLPLHF